MSDGARCHYCRRMPCECAVPEKRNDDLMSISLHDKQIADLTRQLAERDATIAMLTVAGRNLSVLLRGALEDGDLEEDDQALARDAEEMFKHPLLAGRKLLEERDSLKDRVAELEGATSLSHSNYEKLLGRLVWQAIKKRAFGR